MEKLKVLLVILMLDFVELKFFGGRADIVLQDLIAYDSVKIKRDHETPHDYQPESVYYSPFRANVVENENLTESVNPIVIKINVKIKRSVDITFRGKPKSAREVWARNFNSSTQEYSQSTSLIVLMKKIIAKYMSACIPVVLYDSFMEKSEGFILQRLFSDFPTSFIHGKITANFTVDRQMIEPPDSRCRSYILFVADALKTRQIIGAQIDNRVLVVPRSTQWKLQEFLSSPTSRDIINLLVIGESYSADRTKERPYVLYTHQLYVDGLGSNKPKVLTSWLKGRLSRPHIDLFPTKLTKGFAGHRFSVAASNFPPFVFKILKTDGVGNVHVKW